jgi:hypothetical protein
VEDNENDDDDNFASSAVSDGQSYVTRLSPPPFKRSLSSESVNADLFHSTSLRPISAKSSKQSFLEITSVPASAVIPSRPRLETLRPRINPATSFFLSPATPNPTTSFFLSPATPNFPEDEGINFFDLTDDEDDVVSSNNSDILAFQPAPGMVSTTDSFECYSLPESRGHGSKIVETQSSYPKVNSPSLLPQSESGFAVSENNFLGAPIDTGLDDFAAELGWMADIIGSKIN